MDYKLIVDEETVLIDVDADRENGFIATVDGNQQSVRYAKVSDHHLYLSIDGTGYNVFVNDESDGKSVVVKGREYIIQDAFDLERKPSRKKGGQSKPTEVTPVTPSVVVSVLVKEGETVAEGQKVIVLSAMKMEVTLAAPFAGTVTGINTAVGDQVSPGQILVDIEKTEVEEAS